MSRELIDRIAEMLEQVSDENEFLYRKSTGEIICRDPEFLDESTLEDIEVNWKDYILLPTQYDIHEYRIMQDFAFECLLATFILPEIFGICLFLFAKYIIPYPFLYICVSEELPFVLIQTF
ncbi:MAG: hypothetical protein ACI4WS_02990 [Oscillospiraceae bacterium]